MILLIDDKLQVLDMNDDYQLLETIANFLKQGYLINDILKLCQIIYQNDKIPLLEENLNNGLSLEEAIIKVGFDATFIEYFKFFCFKNNVSKAMTYSLKICLDKAAILKKLKKELTYPTLLIIFLVFFSLFVVYGLLPSIMQLFSEFNITPSLPTKIMFSLFKIIPLLVISLIVGIISILTVSIYAVKKQYFKLIDFLITKTKLPAQLIKKYYSLKFALYYNELLLNGYDTTDIIFILYEQIDDSDVKMLIYEIYRQIIDGEGLEMIISDFLYFEPLFIACFKLLLHDNRQDKSLNDYLKMSLETMHLQVTKLIKFAVPIVYCFVATFVILVYITIVIPMMNVVSNL